MRKVTWELTDELMCRLVRRMEGNAAAVPRHPDSV